MKCSATKRSARKLRLMIGWDGPHPDHSLTPTLDKAKDGKAMTSVAEAHDTVYLMQVIAASRYGQVHPRLQREGWGQCLCRRGRVIRSTSSNKKHQYGVVKYC